MEYVLILVLVCAGALAAGPYDGAAAPAKDLPSLAPMLSATDRPPKRATVLAFLRSKALDDGGYKVIDEVTRREAALQKTRDGLGRAERESSDLVYHSLKARLRLALAFGRASVAKRMASAESKSYSMQAMEAAIDATRDAARELELVEKECASRRGEVASAQLWRLHRKLLDVWETAKKRDDLGEIRGLDMQAAVRECLGAGAAR